MTKEEFSKSNIIPASVVEFVFSETRKGEKVLNAEGLEEGDKITIVGIDSEIAEFNGNKYLRVKTTGAASSVSLSRLVGTRKVEKYFGAELAARKDLLSLPHNEAEAVVAVSGLIGKTLEVVKIEEGCGQFEQTFTLFAIVA